MSGAIRARAWRWTLLLASIAMSPGPAPASARESGWIPVGPTGGSVRAMAVDPRNDHVYLGTPDGVLYRSEDRGLTWRRLDPGFPRRGCVMDEIVVDADGVVYVAFWEVEGGGGGVARSDDGGVTFELLGGMNGESVRALAIAPSNPRRIAAGTRAGVFVSDDAGQGWRRISPAGDPHLRNVDSIAFDPFDPQVLYAGTWHLSWKTTDGGAKWAALERGMVDDSHVMTLHVDRRFPRNLFATACTGIYRSTEGGAPWTKLEGIPESSRRTRAFARIPEDPNVLLAGTTEGLWISEDAGGTWRLATGKALVVNALLPQPDGTILLGTEEEGVLRSTDRGRTWTASNAGFTERFVSRLRFDPAGGRVFAAVRGARPNGELYVASGVRGPWTRIGKGLEGRQVLSLAVAGGAVLAGTDDGIFARTRDQGPWTRLEGRLGRVSEILQLDAHRLLAATSRGLVLSTDGGATWAPVESEAIGEVVALTASPASSATPGVILAAGREGFLRSRDGGRSWTRIARPANRPTPRALAFATLDGRVVLATTSAGLLRSRDEGSTWELVAGGLPRGDLTGLAVSADGLTIVTSNFTRGGLFLSTDGGDSWSRVPTRGLVSSRVWTLELDPSDPAQLLASSTAGGLSVLVTPASSTAEKVGSR